MDPNIPLPNNMTELAIYAGVVAVGYLLRHWNILPLGKPSTPAPTPSTPAPTPTPAPVVLHAPTAPTIPPVAPSPGINPADFPILSEIMTLLAQRLQARRTADAHATLANLLTPPPAAPASPAPAVTPTTKET